MSEQTVPVVDEQTVPARWVTDARGATVAAGTRVRRLERSRRERNIRKTYYDVGTAAIVYPDGLVVDNTFEDVRSGVPAVFVRWDDGRNSTIRADRLLVEVEAGG